MLVADRAGWKSFDVEQLGHFCVMPMASCKHLLNCKPAQRPLGSVPTLLGCCSTDAPCAAPRCAEMTRERLNATCALPQLLVICLTFQVLCTIVAVAGINTSKGRITGFVLASAHEWTSLLLEPNAFCQSCPGSGALPPCMRSRQLMTGHCNKWLSECAPPGIQSIRSTRQMTISRPDEPALQSSTG